MPYGTRIRRARILRKLSQTQMSLCLGVHRSAVAQWEQPGGTAPSLEHIDRIAELLEVNFEWLATGRGRMKPDANHDPRERIPAEFARDVLEERLLFASRQLSEYKREAVLALIEALAR